ICGLLQIFGMLLLVPSAARLMEFKFGSEYQKVFFVLFVFWAIIIVIRGLEMDADIFRGLVLNPWFGGFFYFVPLIMLFPKKLIYYKKVIDVIVILGVVYVVFDFMFISNLMEPDIENIRSRSIVEYFSKNLAVPVSFILLTYVYHSKKKNIFAIGILLLTLFFALVRARRGLIFMTVGPLFFV